MRSILAAVVWVTLLILSFLIPGNWLISIGVWVVVVGASFRYFTVLVPEVTGLIVLNFFTGNLHAFSPGLHFKYPWDVVRDKNYFPLELVTERHEETYAAKDGPMMMTKWSYQYRPHERKLDKYITVDKTTIDQGFTDLFSGILSEVIGGWPREAPYDAQRPDTRTEASESVRREITAVEAEVMRLFHAQTMGHGNGSQSPKEKLEDEYGVNFKLFKLADIDFSDDYQQARSGRARMEVVSATAKRLIDATAGSDGQPTISGKEAANLVLVEQGKVKKNIVEVEGGQNEPFLRAAATIGSMNNPKEGK